MNSGMFYVIECNGHEVSLVLRSTLSPFLYPFFNSCPSNGNLVPDKCPVVPSPRMLPVREIPRIEPHIQCLPVLPPSSVSPKENLFLCITAFLFSP